MKKVAINGYGRIGQSILRALYEDKNRHGLQVVAINSLTDIDTLAYMTRYDTTHGRFPVSVEVDGEDLIVDGDKIRISAAPTPQELNWQALDIDLLFECSGSFKSRESATQYLSAGPKKLLFSQPASREMDATVVYGINQQDLKAEMTIASAASCTTNCVTPILHILEEAWGIENGVMTTIHSSMNDQPMVDSSNNQNLRLSRSGLQSIIPVETSLAQGIERIMPHMKGKFDCLHVRVPTMNVSALDLSLNLKQTVSVEEINATIKQASQSGFKGILGYTEEPHASIDFNHDTHSCIFDATQTKVNSGRTLKLFCWFDNEWGFCNRMIDTGKAWLKV
ncbi:type I glyceraldehyde-3-phosphate dehydrogenase [Candidatus Terasakiella magnetica]|uniref:type I glyceraldehyde-3-phosphate dehydrogenase n=1 Tax=Candidatus Terasakiella magnetica TaxID=1867952 RepID=UPI000840A9A0|nr:glyceraldehyde 3-phosphate dehydrogenase NAD-binding domain-containing protein [Candidatus Terasakiella magnetica]